MSSKITSDLELLHPFAKQRAEAVLKDCKAAGLNVAVFETLRTLTRQKWLKSNGQSTTLNSYHRLGLAIDVVFKTDKGNWTWDRPNESWDKLADIFEANGFSAGWRWTSFKDGPHGQLDFTGIRSTTLYAKLNELGGEINQEFNNYLWDLILKDPKYSQFIVKNDDSFIEAEPIFFDGPVVEESKKSVDNETKIEYPKEESKSWVTSLIKFVLSLLGK